MKLTHALLLGFGLLATTYANKNEDMSAIAEKEDTTAAVEIEDDIKAEIDEIN